MPGSLGTFQIVDPADGATVLFDMNDQTGASANPGGLITVAREVNIGRTPPESTVVAPDTGPGGITTFTRYGLVPMTWRQRLQQPQNSFDQLQAGLGRLQQLLSRGCTFLLQYAGSSQIRYIDYEPSDVPPIMGDDAADMFHALTLQDYPEGVPIAIMRQPLLRWPTLDPLANMLLNGSLMLDRDASLVPDSWAAWAGAGAGGISFKAVDSAFDAYRVDIASASEAYLSQSVVAAAGDIWTLQFEAFCSDAAIAQMTATVIWRNGGGAQVGVTQQSAVTPLSVARTGKVVSITTTAAPATTATAECRLRIINASAGGVTIWLRKAMMGLGGLVPYREGAITVSNDPGLTTGAGRAIPHFQQGDAPGPVELILQPLDASVAATEFLVGYKSSKRIPGAGRLADYLNTRQVLQLESGTLGTDTTSTADAQASGGNEAEVAPADPNPGTARRRSRVVATTLLDSMRGNWRIYLRCKPTLASKWGIQLRWGPSAADPAPQPLQEITADWSAATSFEYVDLLLGSVNVPDSPQVALAQVTFEVWARCLSGAATPHLKLDCLSLAPTDRWGRIYVPGASSQGWLGSDLVVPTNPGGLTAGALVGSILELSIVNQAGGTPPVAGLAFAAGPHLASFTVFTGNTGTMTLRVRNITDSNDAATIDISNSATTTYQLPWTAVAGKLYELQAVDKVQGAAVQAVISMGDTFASSMAQNEQARSDPARYAVERLDSSGFLVQDLALEGQVPFYAEPGEGVLWLVEHEVALPAFADPQSKLTRTFKVYKRQSPRSFS